MTITLTNRLAGLGVGLVLLATTVMADTMSWTNAAGGAFNHSANWDTGIPGAADAALFDLDSATGYTVSNVPSGTVNQRLTVINDKVTLDLTGTDYTLTDAEAMNVGAVSNADAHLAIVGGNFRMETRSINVAYTGHATSDNALGTLVIDGVLFNWPADTKKSPINALRLGNWGGGVGNVTLRGGTVITQENGINNLRMHNANNVDIPNRLTITDPGTSIRSGRLQMGQTGSSNPTICVVSNGAAFTTATWDSYVGVNGPAVLTVTGTNTVVSLRAQVDGFYVGKSASTVNSRGVIEVLDGALVRAGLTWTDAVKDTFFGVGGSSCGSLRVEGSGSHYQIDKTASSGKVVRFASNGSTLVVGDGGLVSQTQGSHIIFEEGSFLGGDGTLEIDIDFAGTIKPGGTLANDGWYDVTSGTGTLSIEGNLTLGATAACEMEIGGANAGSHDRIAVDGEVTLNGTLEVKLIDGFEPQANDAFTLLTFTDRNGTTFDAVELPPEQDWELQYGDTHVTLRVLPPAGTVLMLR